MRIRVKKVEPQKSPSNQEKTGFMEKTFKKSKKS